MSSSAPLCRLCCRRGLSVPATHHCRGFREQVDYLCDRHARLLRVIFNVNPTPIGEPIEDKPTLHHFYIPTNHKGS